MSFDIADVNFVFSGCRMLLLSWWIFGPFMSFDIVADISSVIEVVDLRTVSFDEVVLLLSWV